jgi:hypothetical protein
MGTGTTPSPRGGGEIHQVIFARPLIAHLLESKEPARDCVLGGNEGTRAELVVLTKEGEVFHIEVIGMAGTPPAPGAIIVFGKSRGARIDVKGFKYPERKK